jgi:hypothetical protein
MAPCEALCFPQARFHLFPRENIAFQNPFYEQRLSLRKELSNALNGPGLAPAR